MTANRILVIRAGAMGDFILTLPVLTALRKRFPTMPLDIMGPPSMVRLAVDGGLACEGMSIDRGDTAALFTVDANLSSTLSACLKRYALAVSFLPDADGVFGDSLRRAGVAQVLQSPHKPAPSSRIHATSQFLEPLSVLNIPGPAPPPRLSLPAPAAERAAAPHRRPVVVHPGSGGMAKCWPSVRYAALCNELAGTGRDVVLTVGPADDRIAAGVLKGVRSRITVVRDVTVSALAQALQASALVIGNDSGVTHLAAALNTPTAAIFGPTDPAVWGPRGDRVRVLWGDDIFAGDVGAMTWTGTGDPRPLDLVSVDRVMASVVDMVPA